MSDFKLDAALLDVLTLDGVSDSPSIPTDEIWYNYYGLQNATVKTETLVVSAPQYDLMERAYPRADGSYAESAYYRRTRIRVKGVIRSTGRTTLEQEMDAMREAFGQGNVPMRVLWAGQARFYDNCYPVGIEKLFDGRQAFHVSFCPFEMEFESLQPYGRDSDRTVLDSPFAITVSPTSFILSNAGSAPTDTLTYITVVTAGTLSQIDWENVDNGDKITIAGTFNNGDLITIDGEQKSVQINGVAVDYTGVIPKVLAGNNTFKMTLTGSGFSLSLTEQHYSRYFG